MSQIFKTSAGGGGGGSPGGSSPQMQFNNSGSFGGTTGLEFDSATPALRALNTFTGGFRCFNSADVITNTEFLRITCGSNLGVVGTDTAGSGVQRELTVGTFTSGSGRNRLRFFPGGGSTEIQSVSIASAVANSIHFSINPGNFQATSGNQTALSITPTIAQSGGSTGYTGLDINATHTTLGSGINSLATFRVGGGNIFRFSSTGDLTFNSSNFQINTSAIFPRASFACANSSNSGSFYAWGATGTASATVTQVLESHTFTVNQSGGASYLGMDINIVETSTGSGGKSAFQTSLGGVVQFQIGSTGRLRHIAANSSTTVGAAGAAAALPATPTGYLIMEVAGVAQKFPYYAM